MVIKLIWTPNYTVRAWGLNHSLFSLWGHLIKKATNQPFSLIFVGLCLVTFTACSISTKTHLKTHSRSSISLMQLKDVVSSYCFLVGLQSLIWGRRVSSVFVAWFQSPLHSCKPHKKKSKSVSCEFDIKINIMDFDIYVTQIYSGSNKSQTYLWSL